MFRGYALVVTNDINQHVSLPNLGGCVLADGDALVTILSDEDLCGYAPARITVLSGKNATADAVLNAISALAAQATSDDPVLFYFSGHGGKSAAGGVDGSVLFAYDSNPDTGENVLSSKTLGRVWKTVSSRRKLAVLDSCYSGGMAIAKTSGGTEKGLDLTVLDQLASGEGSVAIASSRSDQPSLILPNDSTSLFTKYLVSGLAGHAGHDPAGFVRVFDLFTYVATSVRQQAPNQHPVYSAIHQDENFPVSYCHPAARRKSRLPLVDPAKPLNDVHQFTALMASLYPLGPIDQAIWERAGGDISRLTLNNQGRTDWFRALLLVSKGGGGEITFSNLHEEALGDFPHHPDLIGQTFM